MDEKEKISTILQQNSPDGGFLQSLPWLEFQKKAGHSTYPLSGEDFVANIIEHRLPLVGKYFYCPRGPVVGGGEREAQLTEKMKELANMAKKGKAGWIRIEPAAERLLAAIRKNSAEKIVKAPHDMQPREILVLDITKTDEQLLAEMKPKTRYNIGIAQKKGVKIITYSKKDMACSGAAAVFMSLTQEMARRQNITAHPEAYYQSMIAALPAEMLRIYAAQYEGKIIAVNLVLFFGKFATYLHGASGSEHRNVMAPFLLQWQAILDAKNLGCTRYDFGGVKTQSEPGGQPRDWKGITNFKLGFSPQISPVVFPGSYDIIINPWKYAIYRGLQRAKATLHKMKKS